MNLRSVANAAITSVNPDVPVIIRVSAGYAVGDDGSELPAYLAPVRVMGQVQSLSFSDVNQIEGMNIQGVRRALYVNGHVDGLVRVKNKGGDLVTLPDSTVWLIVLVLESWPTWTKCIITLQNDTALPQSGQYVTIPAPVPALPPAIGGGKIRYAEAPNSAPVVVQPNTRTPVSFVVDPTQTQDFLNPPFKGNLSFDGTRILPRALDDSLAIYINLLVTSQVAGGQIRFDVDVGSPQGPTGTDTASLFNDAGVPERVTGKLYVQTLSYAMQNGLRLYLTSTAPISLVNEAIIIETQSTYGGS